MPFMALNLRDPASDQAVTSGHNKETYAKWSIIDFEFPSLDERAAVKVKWYDGGKIPEATLFAGYPGEQTKDGQEKPFAAARSGVLVIGEKDTLYAPGDYCEKGFTLKSGGKPADVEFEKSPGHFQEWIRAIKGGPAAHSNFPDYAGPLTETILLGNLAVWAADAPDSAGKKVEWDPTGLVATNAPELAEIVRPKYREGWNA
jgi:hypothetical protein